MAHTPLVSYRGHIPIVPLNTPFVPLVERIRHEATIVGNQIVKIDHFLNHRIEPAFMAEIGVALAERIHAFRPEIVLTVEASGIAPALATATVLNLPMVYAKKYTPVVEPPAFSRVISSPTKGDETMIVISRRYLEAGMRVAIIDDFLSNGRTAAALSDIVAEARAQTVVAGFVVEKLFQNGRARLEERGIPVATLAQVEGIADGQVILVQG